MINKSKHEITVKKKKKEKNKLEKRQIKGKK